MQRKYHKHLTGCLDNNHKWGGIEDKINRKTSEVTVKIPTHTQFCPSVCLHQPDWVCVVSSWRSIQSWGLAHAGSDTALNLACTNGTGQSGLRGCGYLCKLFLSSVVESRKESSCSVTISMGNLPDRQTDQNCIRISMCTGKFVF